MSSGLVQIFSDTTTIPVTFGMLTFLAAGLVFEAIRVTTLADRQLSGNHPDAYMQIPGITAADGQHQSRTVSRTYRWNLHRIGGVDDETVSSFTSIPRPLAVCSSSWSNELFPTTIVARATPQYG